MIKLYSLIYICTSGRIVALNPNLLDITNPKINNIVYEVTGINTIRFQMLFSFY